MPGVSIIQDRELSDLSPKLLNSSTPELLNSYKGAVDMLLNMRLEAKRNKDWTTSDKIRNALTELGFTIKDTKDGFEWSL